jgi:hypothetical protein
LHQGRPKFFHKRTASFTAGWFAGHTCKNHNKWTTQPSEVLCDYLQYIQYKPWMYICLFPLSHCFIFLHFYFVLSFIRFWVLRRTNPLLVNFA